MTVNFYRVGGFRTVGFTESKGVSSDICNIFGDGNLG